MTRMASHPTMVIGIALLAACGGGTIGSELQVDFPDDERSVGDIHAEGVDDELPADWGMEATAGHTFDELTGSATSAPVGAPNIVVIVADDLPRELAGFEGNPRNTTPYIDELKRRGVYFENFYLPIGQCGPSRAILWTGLYPTQNGVQTNGHVFTNPNVMVLPKLLRQNGYRTGFFGKCHIGTSYPQDLRDRWLFDTIFHTTGRSKEPNSYSGVDLWDPLIYQIHNAGGPQPGTHFTELITDKAIEFMDAQSRRNRRFFVWLGHVTPHYNSLKDTDAQGGWSNGPPDQRYVRNEMPTALNAIKATDTLEGKPPQQRASTARYFHGYISRRPGGFKEHIRRAHEQLRFQDTQVQRIVDELRALGELDRTLFVFLSDNGNFKGERTFCGKGPYHYDEIIRVPLVLSWPGHVEQNVTRSALIQSTDLSATLLAAAGLSRIPGSKSSSFWPLATGQKAEDRHRRSLFFQYHSQQGTLTKLRGVLKDGFKFTHHLGARYYAYAPNDRKLAEVPLVSYSPETFELYGLNDDPNELHNLLPYVDEQPSALWTQQKNDPTQRRRLNELLRTLAYYQTITDDDAGLRIENIRVQRESNSRAVVDWRSVRRSTGQGAAATAELVFREKDCAGCQVYEYDYKHSRVDHRVPIEGLVAGRAYELLIFSISATSNGGFARYIIPASPGAHGQPGSGSPALNYVWNSYQPEVKNQSGPAPQNRGRCRIVSAGGYVFADYTTLHKICLDDCRLRYATNPGRTCSYNGTVFHRP
ncbi:sulfatase [Myxococcota bacterium]